MSVNKSDNTHINRKKTAQRPTKTPQTHKEGTFIVPRKKKRTTLVCTELQTVVNCVPKGQNVARVVIKAIFEFVNR